MELKCKDCGAPGIAGAMMTTVYCSAECDLKGPKPGPETTSDHLFIWCNERFIGKNLPLQRMHAVQVSRNFERPLGVSEEDQPAFIDGHYTVELRPEGYNEGHIFIEATGVAVARRVFWTVPDLPTDADKYMLTKIPDGICTEMVIFDGEIDVINIDRYNVHVHRKYARLRYL
jgi:hypothetical protein